MCVPVIWCT